MAKTKKDLTEEIGERVEVEVKQPLNKIVPIRLSADHWAELYRYAHELGIGPTTLARMWILEKLALFRATTSAAYAPSGVPYLRNWLAPAPLRLTLDQFIEKLFSALEDLKQKGEQFGKETVIGPDAEEPEDVSLYFKLSWEKVRGEETVIAPDAQKPEDVKGFAAFRIDPSEFLQLLYQLIAKLMGVEIVDEEAEAKQPKVEA